jgi:serine phosphatase RsbU (regulator of sigma subunit)
MFVTIFYGIVEQATGRMTYARAGHDRPPLAARRRGHDIDCPGMALGLFPRPGSPWPTPACMLQPATGWCSTPTG